MPDLHGNARLVCVEGGQRLLDCSPEKKIGRQESAFVVVPKGPFKSNGPEDWTVTICDQSKYVVTHILRKNR